VFLKLSCSISSVAAPCWPAYGVMAVDATHRSRQRPWLVTCRGISPRSCWDTTIYKLVVTSALRELRATTVPPKNIGRYGGIILAIFRAKCRAIWGFRRKPTVERRRLSWYTQSDQSGANEHAQ